MSGPVVMTCERCSELITELVCGELDAAAAADVRAHAEACERCGPELASFTRVMTVSHSLPLESPSVAVEQRIMQAAREANARRAAGAQAIDSGSPSTGLRAWFERLATWAMSPQVAMASVLLLVVGIGLYALPFGPEASGPTALQIAQEEPENAAPTATAASAPMPAEEAADDVAPAAEAEPALEGRTTSAQDSVRAPAKSALERASAPRTLAPELAEKARPQRAEKPAARDAELDDLAGFSGEGAAASEGRSRSGGYAPPPPVLDVEAKGKKESAPGGSAKPVAPAPAPEPAAPSAADEGYALGVGVASNTAPRADSSGPDFAQLLEDGVRAARAGEHERAVQLLEPVVGKGPADLRGTARPWLARSLRALDQCERALAHYRVLVASEKAAPALLDEAADCYQRTGRTDEATALRRRSGSTKN